MFKTEELNLLLAALEELKIKTWMLELREPNELKSECLQQRLRQIEGLKEKINELL